MMAGSILIIALVHLFVLSTIVASSHDHWHHYKEIYKKAYSSRHEDVSRQLLFKQRKAFIDKFNEKQAREVGYTRGLNQFSDWTDDELDSIGGLRFSADELDNSVEAKEYLRGILGSGKPVPDELDWRKVSNRVNRVLDQGNCGSGWAFATAGVLEGQQILRNISNLTPLSVQELVDCPDPFSDNLEGCFGGDMVSGFKFINKQGGIEAEASYPYQAKRQKCLFEKSKVVMKAKGGVFVDPATEDNLKRLVATFGPVSVGLATRSRDFEDYRGGIFSGVCQNEKVSINHAVLVVGYGTDYRYGDFWIVKNSWGMKWGEEGYIRIARNKNNTCGIGLYSVIPIF